MFMAMTHRKRNRRQVMTGVIIVWAALVSLVFFWQLVQYDGLIERLAEWQFSTFGYFNPSITYLALVALLASPGLLVFLRVRHRDSEQRLAVATLRSAIVFRRVVLGLSAACFAAAIVTLLMLLTLPTSVGAVRQIDLGQPVVTLPQEGPTTIDGRILYDRTAVLGEDLVVAHRTLLIAPMLSPTSANADLQFFVELPPETDTQTGAVQSRAAQNRGASSMTGILKRNALPGEIVALFRYAGYRIEPPYYVLFAGKASMRWPYYEIAGELALVALLFLALGVWQHRRIKWLEGVANPPSETTPPAATA